MPNQNPEILTRTLELASRAILDAESRLVRLSFSSEEPVTRQSFFSDPWVEILGHETSEVDLARLNNGAPVLYNHDRSEGANRIGVVERAWLEIWPGLCGGAFFQTCRGGRHLAGRARRHPSQRVGVLPHRRAQAHRRTQR